MRDDADSRRRRRSITRTAGSPDLRPLEFLRSVWEGLVGARALAFEIAKRDLRTRYRDSLFGGATVVLPPLVLTAAATQFRREGILHVDTAVPYWHFVLVGSLLWTTLLDAVHAPIYGLQAEQRLLARTSAPPEAVMAGKLAAVFVNFVVRAGLVLAVLLWDGAPIPWTSALALLGSGAIIGVGATAGFLLAPVNLVYKDLAALLPPATTLWFFLSPVCVPSAGDGIAGTLMALNPVTPLLAVTRGLILPAAAVPPGPAVAVGAAAGVMVVLAWWFVRVTLPVAIEHGSA